MLKKDINEFNGFFAELNDDWAILTAGGRDDFNAMTISWGGIGILWNRPVAFVFVRKTRYTYDFMEKNNTFTLSFLPDKYRKELSFFGSKSGRDFDKFKETGLHPILDIDANLYYVKEATKVLKLRQLFKTDMDAFNFMNKSLIDTFYKKSDFHTIYVAEIFQYLTSEDEE